MIKRPFPKQIMRLAPLIVLFGMVSTNTHAEIFKCTDDQGQVRFQQTPCSYELTQEGIDRALIELEALARGGSAQVFAEEVTRNALGGFADSNGRTVLMLACSDGTEPICRWALESGEDPHRKDSQGQLALAHAARSGRADNLHLLLTHPDVIPYRPGDRVEALRAAVGEGQFETSLMLLETGVDPNFQIANQPTSLAISVDGGRTELVRLLVRHGADPILAMAGGSPVERARDSGNLEVLSALNSGTRRIDTGGHKLSIPVPDLGWDCDVYAPILSERTRQMLAANESDGVCFVESSRIVDLDRLQPKGLGLFRFSWIQPPPEALAESFEATVEQIRRHHVDVFLDDADRFGVMQASRRPAGGSSSMMATCAMIVTAMADIQGTIQFCRYDEKEREDLVAIQAATQRWLDRIVALSQ